MRQGVTTSRWINLPRVRGEEEVVWLRLLVEPK